MFRWLKRFAFVMIDIGCAFYYYQSPTNSEVVPVPVENQVGIFEQLQQQASSSDQYMIGSNAPKPPTVVEPLRTHREPEPPPIPLREIVVAKPKPAQPVALDVSEIKEHYGELRRRRMLQADPKRTDYASASAIQLHQLQDMPLHPARRPASLASAEYRTATAAELAALSFSRRGVKKPAPSSYENLANPTPAMMTFRKENQ